MALSSARHAANESRGQLNINPHHVNAVRNYHCMSKKLACYLIISPTDCCGDGVNDITAVNKDLKHELSLVKHSFWIML